MMELFAQLPKEKGNKKTLRDLAVRERTTIVKENYVFVQETEQLLECAMRVQEYKHCAFDVETSGVAYTDYSVCLGISVHTNTGYRCWIIPTAMQYAFRNFQPSELREALGTIFANPLIAKIGHNVKFDMRYVENTYGMKVAGVTEDTMIAQSILNENERHSLEAIAERYLQIKAWKFKQDGHFSVWPLKIATNYLGGDVETTLRVYEFQRQHWPNLPKLSKLYYETEIPNMLIAYEMEQYGIGWDSHYYETVMKPEIRNAKNLAEQRVKAVLGHYINLDSPAQVSEALFGIGGLGLEMVDGKSVNKKVLAVLRSRHKVIRDLETYRKYSTIDKMFVSELSDFVVNGRIHANMNTNKAKTGRWSVSSPNLQQLPKASIGPVIRRAFIPSDGFVLITMDYSQIELRMLAHWSRDANLVRAFLSGEDIHSMTCCLMFPQQITMAVLKVNKDHPLRVRAKTINFGILYGMGPQKLMETLNALAVSVADMITLDDARALIDRWFDTFPKARQYVKRMKQLARDQGYVESILNRKRRLPEASSFDRAKSSSAERQAVNFPLQASAADMLKTAQIKVRAFIKERKYPIQIMLAVHDELVMEVPRTWLQHNQGVLDEVSAVMRDALPLHVPVLVSVDVLSRWGDVIREEEMEYADEAI